jgi:leader peptidase (prepilin peptidase)/N-methyltransferase
LVLFALSCSFFIFFPAINYLDYATQSTYLLFCLALWITAHTDAQTLLISRFVTLFLAPLGWLAAQSGLLLITPLESVIGALLGLITLGLTARLAYRWTGQESLGQGDIDLLIFIGAFLGPIGCWQTLLIGSITGSLFWDCFITYVWTKSAHVPITIWNISSVCSTHSYCPHVFNH